MRRYWLYFALGSLIVLAANGTLNWYVDAFGYFGRSPLGIYGDGYAREWVASTISKQPYDAAIMGTSKTIQIPAQKIQSCRTFNASFNGGRPEEFKHFIEHSLPREMFLLLGLDLFIFNEEPLRNPSFGLITFDNLVSYVFSLGATQYTLNTIDHWSDGKPGGSLLVGGGRSTEQAVKDNARYPAYDYERVHKIVAISMFKNFRLSEARFEILREIRQMLERRGQRYAVFLNPVSPGGLAFFKSQGLLEASFEFRKRVREIFPDTIDLTDGAYSRKEFFYKTDSLHYLPHIGAKFIDEILEQRGCVKGRPS